MVKSPPLHVLFLNLEWSIEGMASVCDHRVPISVLSPHVLIARLTIQLVVLRATISAEADASTHQFLHGSC